MHDCRSVATWSKLVVVFLVVYALLYAIALTSACSCGPPPEKYEERRAAILNDPLLDPFLAHRRALNEAELAFLLGSSAIISGSNASWRDIELAAAKAVAASLTTNLPYSHLEATSHADYGTRLDMAVDLFESSGLCQYTVTTSTQVCCFSGATVETYLGFFVTDSAGEITAYLAREGGGPLSRRRHFLGAVNAGTERRSSMTDVFAVSLTAFARVMQLRQIPLRFTGPRVPEAEVADRLRVLSDVRTMAYWRSLAQPPPTWFNCTSAKYSATRDPYSDNSGYVSIYSSSCSTSVTWLSKQITLCPNGLAELLIEEEVSLFCPGIGRDHPKLRLLGTFTVDAEGNVQLTLGGPHPSEMRNGTLSTMMAHTSFPHNATTTEVCTEERAQQLYDAFDTLDNLHVDTTSTEANAWQRQFDEAEKQRREAIQRQAQLTIGQLMASKAFSFSVPQYDAKTIQNDKESLRPQDIADAFAAVEADDVTVLRLLLSRHGGDVWIDVERGAIRETLAHVAASKGSVTALRELIRAEAVNFTRGNLFGETALYHAAERRDVECVEALLEAMTGSDQSSVADVILSETVYKWSTAYVAAVVNNDTAVLSALLRVAPTEIANAMSSQNGTLLYDSAVRGSTAAVELLLSAGASREASFPRHSNYPEVSWQETVVVGAIAANQKETSLVMIRGGTFPPRVKQQRESSLWASWRNWLSDVLFSSHSNDTTPISIPPLNLSVHPGLLHEAAAACHLEAVEALLANLSNESYHDIESVPHQFPVRRARSLGDTPLTAATLCLDLDAALSIARLLLQRGASVQCTAGRCPLVEAIVHRRQIRRNNEECLRDRQWQPSKECPSIDKPDLVDLFLEHHADVNGVDGLGRSAIAVATSSTQSEVSLIKVLLDRGADPRVGVSEIRSINRFVTPLQAALALKEVEVVKLLLSAKGLDGVMNDVTVPQNWTLLHAAVQVTECWKLHDEDGAHVQELLVRELLTILVERRSQELNFSAVDEKGDGILLTLVACPKSALKSVVDEVISRGADVNQKNLLGETPLLRVSRSSFNDRGALVRLLLRRGANASAANSEGLLPLHGLIENFWGLNASAMVEILELLLHAAPNTAHQPAPNGMPPLTLIVLNRYMSADVKYEAARTLLSFDASVPNDLWNGQTALQHAIDTNAKRSGQHDPMVEDRLIELLRG